MKHNCMKRITFLLIFTIFILIPNLFGQIRNIQGRVLSEDLEPLPGVEIRNNADSTLGKTEMDGRFKINISQEVDSLFFRYVGMEWTDIALEEDCNSIEILIMNSARYHYKSSNKIDRLRKRRYDDLIKEHSNAVAKGLFKSRILCYKRSFEPWKPELDSIKKRLNSVNKENLNQFKTLQEGDTVKIPLGFDSPGKIVNTYYSICRECTEEDYEYVIKGIIMGKHRRHLTLDIKVISMLPYNSIEYEGSNLTINSRFKYKMKYFNVVIN